MIQVLNQKPEPILEYQTYEEKCESIIINEKEKEIFLGSDRTMWLLPGRTYYVPTGVRFWFPENSIGLITSNTWMNPKIHVHSTIAVSDCEIYLRVQNIGFLPRPIVCGQMLANLIVIPKMECHIINTKGQS